MKQQVKKQRKPQRNRWVLPAVGAVLVAAAAIAIVAFTSSGGSTTKRSARVAPPVVTDEMQVAVDVVDNAFKPPSLKIKKGATITWEFVGKIPHNVTEDPDATRTTFASDTKVSGTFAHTFDIVGTFYYHCTIHHIMQGTVEVSE